MARARRRLRRLARPRHGMVVPTLALSLLAAALVAAIAWTVFPYHSLNHDEGVYLQQAALLLDGQLALHPPVSQAFRPWFFVAADWGLYPKYAPVPAAMFAAGKLAGASRLALAAIAAVNVALVVDVVRQVFDRRTGLLAGAIVLASPLFLVNSSVFLPYAPTTLWNLLFATAYVRSVRTGNRPWALLAGLAIGVAFFARPYTAVLFAAPFVVHALWTLCTRTRETILTRSLTAAGGLLGIAAALGYNWAVTGDPFVFPYLAFAPTDGLGFGHHAMLGYEVDYTPLVALRANARVLAAFATRWMTAGVLGTAAALAGFSIALSNVRDQREPLVLVLAGVGASVLLGNVFFWGNLNVLGEPTAPGDGLIHYLGPYYHFDLLLPAGAFAAVGVRAAARRVARVRAGSDWGRRKRTAVRVALAAVVVLAGVATIAAVARPVATNEGVTTSYRQAYAPFDGGAPTDAVVFLPTPYGEWLNHPFQALRNDPGFDSPRVYALPVHQFRVADAFPDRTLYRYTYRGRWSPTTGEAVEPSLQRIEVVSGQQVSADIGVGTPRSPTLVSARLAAGNESSYGTYRDVSDRLDATLVFADGRATLRRANGTEAVSVPLDGREQVDLTLYVDYGTGTGFSYRFRTPVAREDGRVRAMTPRVGVCQSPLHCTGGALTRPAQARSGVFANARLSSGGDDSG
ncbi:MAG: ArnT family glycosyltransferase [Haloarculaceae archaeon]